MIEMKPVKSSNVKAAGYDAKAKELHIQFGNGATYRYSGVPEDVYNDLCLCESIGRFVANNLKGKFEHERLPDEPKDGRLQAGSLK